MFRILSFVFGSVFVIAVSANAADPAKPVDYTRDIKPILSDRCYACHGPDEKQRQKNLRLDVRESAVKSAITPGDADASELVDRLQAEEKDYYMPPPSSKKPRLTKEQISLIKRWINEGAKFDEHWAYVKPVRPQVPPLTPIPSPPRGEGGTWVRNPIDNFIAIQHAKHGFRSSLEADRVTLVRRLSFDLIGLPPSPEDVDPFLNDKTPEAYEKLVAKLLDSKHFGERMALYWLDLVRYADTGGYHSDNHRDVALYRDYVIDAFNKNKPFDQFTIEQLAGDLLPNATLEQRIASGYNRLLMTTEEGGAQPKEYAAKYAADRVRNVSVVWLASTMGCCECHDHKFDPFRTKEFYSLGAFFADVQEKPVGRQDQTQLPSPQQAAELKQLDAKIAELKKKLHEPSKELDAVQVKWEEELKGKKPGKEFPKPVLAILAIEPDKRNPKQKQTVFEYFRSVTPQLKDIQTPLAETQKRRDALNAVIPITLLSMSGQPRTMRVLPRGNWLDDSGEIVQPEVPAALGKLGFDRRANRLDLAKWLVSPDNPIAARVFVNRLWKIAFGSGLVKSLDDFGSQGAPPTHPQLLDWLAVEFQQSGWNVKHMLTLIVTSATYRQSSVGTKDLHERDPGNLWLARQNRFRLDAEFVRDNALAVAGMLSPHVGGPSVRPAQPAGYWSFLNFPVREWQKDRGEQEYRRGLYIYWCRSFLHPYLLAFDAPSREECTVERPRSSTPVQALVLLNDPNFVEAARVFAEKIVHEGGQSNEQRFTFAYRRALSRLARPDEIKVLTELLDKHRAEFVKDKQAAKKLLSVGDWPQPKDLDPVELAAWTSVARVILNLNETMIRD
jgi:hypothetical protein